MVNPLSGEVSFDSASLIGEGGRDAVLRVFVMGKVKLNKFL
jgi:hypothetical protein